MNLDSEEFLKDYRSFVFCQRERYGKSTLFENEHVLVGLNCLGPGQEMEKHAHEVQCRFYVVLEGSGRVWIGNEQSETEKGMVIWVPSGLAHRIMNTGSVRMVLLVGITPSQTD
jgi:mannose-6-phosphate isomerase-like protein (cupin superfamily)